MNDSHSKELFNQIKEKFEYLFKVKGLGKNSYIEPKTWFLKNDLKFQELLKNSLSVMFFKEPNSSLVFMHIVEAQLSAGVKYTT